MLVSEIGDPRCGLQLVVIFVDFPVHLQSLLDDISLCFYVCLLLTSITNKFYTKTGNSLADRETHVRLFCTVSLLNLIWII